MEFSIWLDDEERKSKRQLALQRTKLEGRSHWPDIEMCRKFYGLEAAVSFEWDATERALCYLLLRAFSSGVEPPFFRLRGNKGGFAYSLYDLLRLDSAKAKPEEATWIVRMFTDANHIKRVLHHSGTIRLPPSLFEAHWLRNKSLPNPEFTVKLGSEWRDARFRTYIFAKSTLCSSRSYRLLSQLIKDEKPTKINSEYTEFIISVPLPPEDVKNNEIGLVKLHIEALTKAKINQVSFLDVYEGSTQVVVRLAKADSDILIDALITGSLDTTAIQEITLLDETDQNLLRTRFRPLSISVNLHDSESQLKIADFCRKAYFVESLRRPWVRLFSLLSTDIVLSQARNVIAESTRRSYSLVNIREKCRSIKADLLTGLCLYPGLCIILIVTSSLFMSICGLQSALWLGIITGVALAAVGSQGCSMMISPLACTAGIIFVGWGFGFAHSIILGIPQLAAEVSISRILENPFVAIDGGLVGLTAPFWLDVFSQRLVILLLFVTCSGIAISGWLMGQPFFAEGRYERRSNVRDVGGALLGTLGGLGIPLTLGIFTLLKRADCESSQAFSIAFGITAFLGTSFIVWLQNQRVTRIICCGAIQGFMGWFLCTIAFFNAGTVFGLIFNCMACAYFQSTWFGCSFEIARKVSSPRAAVWATFLEGVLGYLTFIVLEAAHIV